MLQGKRLKPQITQRDIKKQIEIDVIASERKGSDPNTFTVRKENRRTGEPSWLTNIGVAELALRFYRETSFATPDERWDCFA